MLWLTKETFTVLLSFSASLATKCVYLINEPCMTRPILLYLNLVELNYYLFMVSLHKCSGSCYVVDDLSTKICVPSKIKDVNVKLFSMITRMKQKYWQACLMWF